MKIYYGWHVVAISILALALAIGGSIQAFGLFVGPISESLNLTRAQVNTGAILLNLGMAISSPLVGRLLDRHSARMVATVSAVLFGASIVALGLSTNILLSSLLVLVPLAAAAVGCGTVTSPALVARWFKVHRGRAMAIAMMGISLGPITVVPVVSLLIESWGWRRALIIQGLMSVALLLLAAWFVRDRPGPNDREPGVLHDAKGNEIDGIRTTQAPQSVGIILRLPQFWSIGMGLALAFGIMQAIIVSLVPVGTGAGLSLTQGASLISMYGASAMIGSLLVVWRGDRFDRLGLLTVLVGLFTLAAASPALADGYVPLLACAMCMGIVGGAITPIFLALLADLFGPASFGTVNGTASLISTVVGALFIRASGEIFDRTGGYEAMYVAFLAVGALATVLVFLTGRLNRRPRQV